MSDLVEQLVGVEEPEEDVSPAEAEDVEEAEEVQEEEVAETEPEPEPEEKLVPLAALHEARSMLKEMREENQRLRESQKQPEPPADDDDIDIDKLDDDDVLTVAQLKAMQKREAKQRAQTVQQQLNAAEEAFASQHSKDQAPAGLDFETVMRTGTENLSHGDKAEIQRLITIGQAEKAVEFTYKRAIERTPDLLLKRYQSEQASVAEKTKSAKVAATPTLKKRTVAEIKSAPDQLIDDLLGPDEDD